LSKKNNELVSIITPNHNGAQYIAETIRSVRSQSYPHWEMIIIDDCSTDNSLEIIKEFIQTDNRIKIVRHVKKVGPAKARNSGIKIARGRYVAFIDSDDLWLPEKLEIQVAFMLEKKTVLSYTSYKKINENNDVISKIILAPDSVIYKELLLSCSIGNSTAMYDADKLNKMYVPDILTSEDHALWLSILKQGYTARGIIEPLTLYRVHRKALSRNKIRKAFYQWQVYRNLEHLTIFKSLYYMSCYAYYGLKKYTT